MAIKLRDITLTADTGALVAGDIITDTAEVFAATQGGGSGALLESLVLLDEANQGQAVDVVFFSSNKSLGTKNAAVSLSDADAREIIGVIPVLTTDYVALIGSQVATKRGCGMVIQAPSDASVFVSLIVRSGTPTYAASSLKLQLGIIQE